MIDCKSVKYACQTSKVPGCGGNWQGMCRKKAWITLDPGRTINRRDRANEAKLRVEIKFDDDGAFFGSRLVFPLHYRIDGSLNQNRIAAQHLYVFHFAVSGHQQLYTSAAGDIVPSGQIGILGLNAILEFARAGLSKRGMV